MKLTPGIIIIDKKPRCKIFWKIGVNRFLKLTPGIPGKAGTKRVILSIENFWKIGVNRFLKLTPGIQMVILGSKKFWKISINRFLKLTPGTKRVMRSFERLPWIGLWKWPQILNG